MVQEQLIKACIRGDRQAQKVLYETYKKSLFGVSLKYCRNTVAAEDNLHNSFLIIFDKLNNYQNTGSFEGWMKRIAINTAISSYKKDFQLVPLLTDFEDAVQFSENDLDISIDFLLKIIQELPDQYRLVFNLYELDNYSHGEIATLLSISESASKSNLHRAKVILKEKLTKHKFQQKMLGDGR